MKEEYILRKKTTVIAVNKIKWELCGDLNNGFYLKMLKGDEK